jgi:NAD(P)-dependent dehydrogenase (short-subunit alcohol dehydrogenase family)
MATVTTSPPRSAVPLADRVVLVVGGTGFVGGYVVRALRDAGARVIVPTRKPQAVPRPGSSTSDDRVRLVHVRSWDDPVELREAVAAPGWQADAVVAAIGGWWIGTELTDLAPALWRELVETHLTGHFLAARSLAPLLVDAGLDPVYVMVNGTAGREAMALSGPVSVGGAGQTMLMNVLRAESVGRAVRFHEVVVLAAVAGDERNLTPVSEISGATAAAAVLEVLADPAAPVTVEVHPT